MNAAAEDHKRWTCLRSLIPPILARLRELKEASRRDAIAARRWDAPGADPPTPAEDPTAEYIGQEWIGDAMRVARELESLGFASDAEFLRQQTEFGRPGFSTPTELEAVHNIATLLARHTPEGDWCVSQDGLTPIAEAVHDVADPDAADIVKWLLEADQPVIGDLHSPLGGLLSALRKSSLDRDSKVMTSTRREMVRRWLQTNGYEPDAKEFESRMTMLIEELDSWQSEAHYIAYGRDERQTKERNGEFVELVDIFGDDTREWFYGLTEQAEDTWNYLMQLDNTIRAKLAKPDHQPEGDAEAAKLTSDVAHSPDFRSVLWDEKPHTFTALQAACVKVLWENWNQGTPEVGEQTILELADTTQKRLSKVFDDGKHSAWGTMIVPGASKGTFRLSEAS